MPLSGLMGCKMQWNLCKRQDLLEVCAKALWNLFPGDLRTHLSARFSPNTALLWFGVTSRLIAQHRGGLFGWLKMVSQSSVRDTNVTAAGQAHPEERNLLSIVYAAWMASQSALKEKLCITLSTVSEWEEEERNAWQVPALPWVPSCSATAILWQVRWIGWTTAMSWIGWTTAMSPCSLACLNKIQLFLCLLGPH